MATSVGRSAATRVDLIVIWCIVGLVLGVALALAMPGGEIAADAPLITSGIALPSPDLSPDEVVGLQLAALQAFRDNDAALLQCFVFASPLNRAATGPLPRFAAMVRNPLYRPLVERDSALVGKAMVRGDRATVLVTVIDAAHRASVYRWFLSKQTDLPYRGCWMTDGVVTGAPSVPPEPSQPTVALPLERVQHALREAPLAWRASG